MDAIAQPRPRQPAHRPPTLRVIEARRRRTARLHLFTYLVGSALFWLLWAAISVSADTWYWWATVPIAAWTIVLALHLVYARRVRLRKAAT